MLIKFTVANFLSFYEKTSLELFASKGSNLKEQLWFSNSRYIPNILKSAFVFGPNASGKSNLITALHYAKSIILQEPNPLRDRITHFKLVADASQKPSFFEFEILIGRKIFRYGFEIKARSISREWLWQNRSTGEHMIYERSFDPANKNRISYGESYQKYREDQFFGFILQATPANKLLLSELIDRNVEDFRQVYDWFRKIVVIYPDSEWQSFNILLNNDYLLQEYRRLLKTCDLGIDDVRVQKLDVDDALEKIPDELKNMINLSQTKSLNLKHEDRYFISLQDTAQEAYKIQILHKMPDTNESIGFSIAEESDGTNRLFDLIPILLLILADAIILVDELDRSLHPNISKHFVKTLFETNKERQAQFIVSTHDATLLDVKLLRRDSIWFVKKNHKKASELYSLCEYIKVRNDKSLQKAYLAGLYGAIPIIRTEDEQ